ncbi:uncharacterized protein VTP21DRAFT_5740 [Calcarisporiella thermophila]|uniref:uncharacterized protein n=1 Tax=Calcarisporiella thermophila TaxID=911321 RepID=UPI003744607C
MFVTRFARQRAPSPFLRHFLTQDESKLKMEGPIYQNIQRKLTENLNPLNLEIINESHLHAHHAAMKGVTSKETHFRVSVVSDAFEGKNMMQRHRMIYGLLDEEFKGGLHALSLKTKTTKELANSSTGSAASS